MRQETTRLRRRGAVLAGDARFRLGRLVERLHQFALTVLDRRLVGNRDGDVDFPTYLLSFFRVEPDDHDANRRPLVVFALQPLPDELAETIGRGVTRPQSSLERRASLA